MDLRSFSTVSERRKALEKKLEINLESIGSFSLDEFTASKRNCELMIGVAQIPMGVAGSLRLRSVQAEFDDYYVPLATTEGALVASINRGCKAVREGGGANVFVEKVGVTRGPVFKTGGLSESFRFQKWLNDHFDDLNNQSVKTSSHIKLLKIEPRVVGENVFVRFVFDSADAMGMNMATIATESLTLFIKKETGVKCLSVSGNFCTDKKPSWQNFILGRGFKVWAEVFLTKKVVKEVLKTTPEDIYNIWLNKCMLGSAVSGSMGFNAQFANVISAIFLATGQDPAHIVEGSLGITTVSLREGGLYFSIYLPDLMVGTVGGGTGLATQKEALSIVGPKNLVKVIGGAVLAGEISLLASLSEQSLAKAHRKLGRGGR
jgi:hydroxymethylglutaryl-CoA reductase (NADPH)